MKKFILALMVVATIVSCGKNGGNNVASGTAGVTNPITVTVAGATDLGSRIDNYTTYFGTGYTFIGGNSYQWNQIIYQTPNISYKYTKATSAASNSNCTTKWSIFYFCSSSSSASTSSLKVSNSIIHSSIDVLAKQNELKGYINRANPYYAIQTSGTLSYIRTTDNMLYVIDTSVPLQANPVSVQQANGQVEYLLGFTL